jgi:hypothetical protein
MGRKTEEAKSILNCFLFEEIDNNRVPHEDRWQITWEGNDFVLWDMHNDKLHHFEVKIKPKAWDSYQAREDQEWDI